MTTAIKPLWSWVLSLDSDSATPNPSFCFFKPLRGGLAGVFQVTVLLHCPIVLELEALNWWPDVMVTSNRSCPGPEAHCPTHYHHPVWLAIIFFWSNAVLFLPQSFCLLGLRDHQDGSWQIWEEPIRCLWSAVVLRFFTCCSGSFCDLLAESSSSSSPFPAW